MNREAVEPGAGVLPTIDWVKLRGLADQFGYWPATTDPSDIERHRRQNAERFRGNIVFASGLS